VQAAFGLEDFITMFGQEAAGPLRAVYFPSPDVERHSLPIEEPNRPNNYRGKMKVTRKVVPAASWPNMVINPPAKAACTRWKLEQQQGLY